MLARQITGEAHSRALGSLVSVGESSADYVVTSDAEWAAVFANDAATPSGKIVEISGTNFTELTIANRDMAAEGAPVTIRSADASSAVQRVVLLGVVRGIDFSGLNFQMQGWPANYNSCCHFAGGTFGALRFNHGTSFRHGYGASLADFDTTAELPEYERVDNVQTAITASATYPLAWKDTSATSGWVEFFNRGTETVHVAFGDAQITASASDTACLPGARTRISGLDPTTDTHFAIIAEATSSEVNARAEIGLAYYLAASFTSSGSASIEDMEIVGCTFRDVSDGVKGVTGYDDLTIMDNDFDRVYADLITLAPHAGGVTRVLRNMECLTFSRAGLAENLSGDAGDPHGGSFQMLGDGLYTNGPVYFAGNRVRVSPMRDGAHSGGAFLSDNDIVPSYSDIFFVNVMQIGGTSSATNLGETGWPIRDAFLYGETIVSFADITSIDPQFRIYSDGSGTVYTGSLVAMNIVAVDQPFQQDGTVDLQDVASITAVFPKFADLASASTRPDLEAALTTAAEGAGLGMAATVDTIDWTTTNPDAVIRWQNLPSGAHWNAVGQLTASTLTTLPLRKIMNRRAAQTVSVGAGTEWRSVDTDGITEVQAWTNGNGTIEPGQFIQIRATSSAASLGTVTATVTINGFAQSVVLTTALTAVSSLIVGGTPGYFVDPAAVPAGTSRITFRGQFNFPSITSGMKPFAQSSTGCDFIMLANGGVNATVEDGTGAKVLASVEVLPVGSITPGVWHEIVFDVNHASGLVTVTLDGVETVTAFTAAGNGLFQSIREVSLLATAAGGNPMPSGTRVADLSVEFDGVLHKAISNDAATANADDWHQGSAFSDG